MDVSNVSFNDFKEYILFGFTILTSAFTAGVIWTKLVSRIDANSKLLEKKASLEELNGFGIRVSRLESECATRDGRMDHMEKELIEYRRDASDAGKAASRVEKSVEDLRGELQQGNLVTGSHLAEIKTLLQANDKASSNRLVRLETITQIEKKLGTSLPTD